MKTFDGEVVYLPNLKVLDEPLINQTRDEYRRTVMPFQVAYDTDLRLAQKSLVTELRTANMGGEDFAEYLEVVPGAYIRIGAQVPGRENFPAHSSRFDFDESALPVGAAWLARVARDAAEAMAG